MTETVVALLQSGSDGPVMITTAVRSQLRRRIDRLQDGNPEQLALRVVLHGGSDLEERLASDWHDLRIRGRWHRPAALDRIPADAVRIPFDTRAEQARHAAGRLGELARSGRTRP